MVEKGTGINRPQDANYRGRRGQTADRRRRSMSTTGGANSLYWKFYLLWVPTSAVISTVNLRGGRSHVALQTASCSHRPHSDTAAGLWWPIVSGCTGHDSKMCFLFGPLGEPLLRAILTKSHRCSCTILATRHVTRHDVRVLQRLFCLSLSPSLSLYVCLCVFVTARIRPTMHLLP